MGVALIPTADAPSSNSGSIMVDSDPIRIGSPERANNPSTGGGGLDIGAIPVPTSSRSNADGVNTSPVLGRREARGLEWTVVSPTSKVERRTRGDLHRLHAIYSDDCLTGEVGLDSAGEDSTFRAAQRKCLILLRVLSLAQGKSV